MSIRSCTSGSTSSRCASESGSPRSRPQQLGRRHPPQVLAVQPGELGDVEHRAAERDPLEREGLDELLERELLALVRHRPAHERQVVEQRLREEAGLAVEVEAHRVLALRDLRAVGVAQQRQVAEDRRLPAEALVEPRVLRQRREPLLGADHVRDAHQVVVDHVGQVVGRKAVALQQDLVVDLRVVDRDVAAQQVVDDALALARHRQPHDVGLAGASGGGRPPPAASARQGRRSRSSASPPSAARAARRAARACRSTGRRPRAGPAPPRARGRSRCARSGGRARAGRPGRGPRPSSRPSQCSASKIIASLALELRSRSVSSMRRTNWPPCLRASA